VLNEKDLRNRKFVKAKLPRILAKRLFIIHGAPEDVIQTNHRV
jgi:hypothetical protein